MLWKDRSILACVAMIVWILYAQLIGEKRPENTNRPSADSTELIRLASLSLMEFDG
jgi:hypothetical protein